LAIPADAGPKPLRTIFGVVLTANVGKVDEETDTARLQNP
jgi:hypothetical protein